MPIYIRPYFLAHYYLQKAIQKILYSYKFVGSILDVGCGDKPYKHFFKNATKYEGIDFKKYSMSMRKTHHKPNYYFNKNYEKTYTLPFANETYDHVVSFQVLEHHRDPKKFVSELIRITKKNGYILITAPFLGGIHEAPHDFQRFTRYGLEALFSNKDTHLLEIKEIGSVFSTISLLCNEYLTYISGINRFTYIICAFLFLPFLFLSYISIFLDKIFISKVICFNYILLAQKK